ncbi:MAG TPA: phosphate signaling complex protein PhoU [Candidatus Thermoplasmatota archaeon]|jgi:phosphate transport system protein|nr:phosphate signaling complex protein PhoU [Candidatus Thermoplasmatota archaeon]
MTQKFHDELEELKTDIIKMGKLSKEMLQKSVDSLKNDDVDLACWVQSQKGTIAQMDRDVEAKAVRLIALYQPMAKDMRSIACCLKLNTYLTRIGRYGKDIAKVTDELHDVPRMKKLVSIPHMAEIVCTMIDNVLTAFTTEDLSSIQDLEEKESTVDELRYSIFRECLTYMLEDNKNITQGAHFMMVSRYLERCGDHACKIAEKIHYMVTGEHIEIDISEKKLASRTCQSRRTKQGP